MHRYFAVVLAPLSWLSAQDAPPQFVPKVTPMAHMRVDGIAEIRAAWGQTGIGRLFADPDVEAAVAKYGAWTRKQYARRTATYEAASRMQLELQSYEASNMFAMASPLGELNMPFREMSRLEFYALASFVDGVPLQGTVTSVSCLPKFEGRWTSVFEREAAVFRSSTWCAEQEAATVGDYDAYRFTPTAEALKGLGDRGKGVGKWMLHLPRTFVTGTGVPDELGTVDMSPANVTPGLSMLLSVKGYADLIMFGNEMPAALGLDMLKRVIWSNRLDGEDIVEDFALELADGVKPEGLVGALLEGGGALIPQALPKGALAQLRFTIGYKNWMAAIQELSDGERQIPEEWMADVAGLLDGSVAVGVCAPKGGMIPQLFLSLGLADADAFDRLLARAVAEGVPVKNVTYVGTKCTLVKIPDMPSGIQPALCRVGNTLHIAESGLSLRAFLKAQKDGVEAMEVGDAKVPAVAGDVVPTFDARFDLPLIYRNFYKKWLPLFEMAANSSQPLSKQDMPDPDVVDEFVDAIRGVAFRDGNRLVLRHTGTVGPVLAGYLMAWPPMGSGEMGGGTTDRIADIICRSKLRSLGSAMSAFEQREGRLPMNLAELFVAEKLPGDAFLMPMDDQAETFELASGAQVKTSFRYFPDSVDIGRGPGDAGALLIEIAPSAFGRCCLQGDCKTRNLYGEESRRDIEEFGR